MGIDRETNCTVLNASRRIIKEFSIDEKTENH